MTRFFENMGDPRKSQVMALSKIASRQVPAPSEPRHRTKEAKISKKTERRFKEEMQLTGKNRKI